MSFLPINVIRYLKGLMCVFENANCESLARIVISCHDGLSKVLNNQKFGWQILLQNFCQRTFGKLSNGWLIIDDTVINKRFAKNIENIDWIFDSKLGKAILGLNIVLLAWSNGKITIPIAFKVYQKHNQKSKIDLAVELLEIAYSLGIKPKYVAFDSWYAAEILLKKIINYHWFFVTQLKKNRKINNVQLRDVAKNPYWIKQGKLSGGIEVSVARNGKKFFTTNNLSWGKQQLLKNYRTRWSIENIFRMLHYKLGLDQCESRKLQAQTAHFYLCLIVYMIFEKYKTMSNKSIYQLKQRCSFDPRQADFILNQTILNRA